jgi:hypothetical protein
LGQHENNVTFPVILIQVEILIACPKFLKIVRHLQLLVNYYGLFRADAVDADAAVTVRLLIAEFIEVNWIPFRCHTPSGRPEEYLADDGSGNCCTTDATTPSRFQPFSLMV